MFSCVMFNNIWKVQIVKSKKLATLVAIPLALSFSLGMSACSAPTNPVKVPVAQEQAIDAVTFKANAVETMESVKKILLVPETANSLIDETNKLNGFGDDFDKDGKMWNQLEPLLGFPTDDASLVKYVYGENPSVGETPRVAKNMIIGLLMGDFFDFHPGEIEKPDVDKLDKYTYTFTSTNTLADGTIQPQHQAMVLKDKNDAITDVRSGSEGLGFTKEGKKLVYDTSFVIDDKSDGIKRTLDADAVNVAVEAGEYIITHETKSKITKGKIEKHIKDTVKGSEGNMMEFSYDEKEESFIVTVTNGDLKSVYDTEKGGIEEPELSEEETEYSTNLLLEVARSVSALDSKNLDLLMKDPSSYEKSIDKDNEDKEVTKIIMASEISKDKSKLKATIEGTVYWFAIPK